MPAYVIYQGEVTDPERYDVYKAQVPATIAAAGGRYIVRGGAVESLEGDAPAGRTVIVEFPTMDAALAWYRGDAYDEVRQLRERASNANLYVIEGVE